MRTLFILLLTLNCFAGTVNLDSLVKKSYASEGKARHLNGFIFHHHLVPLIPVAPPEEPNKNVSSPAPTNDVEDLKIAVAKLSVSVDYLQKASESHGNNMDFILKLVELIIGGISAIVVAYVTTKVAKKAGSNDKT